jgi:hypothetical protein
MEPNTFRLIQFKLRQIGLYGLMKLSAIKQNPISSVPDNSMGEFQPGMLLTDKQIDLVNEQIDWAAFTCLPDGRRIGKPFHNSKRSRQNFMADGRIDRLNEIFGLDGKRVTELGSFEGIHSTVLAGFNCDVNAVDARPINLAKSAVRASLYGKNIRLTLCDLDNIDQLRAFIDHKLLDCDVLVSIGVLYHLLHPVEHLEQIFRCTQTGVLLDTHVADSDEELRNEFGMADPFSGTNFRSLWLSAERIIKIANENRFEMVGEHSVRSERNGTRATFYFQKMN